jgi:hypothetical protein
MEGDGTRQQDAAIEVDLGSAQDVSFVAIASHNAADIAATMTTSIAQPGLPDRGQAPPQRQCQPTIRQSAGIFQR